MKGTLINTAAVAIGATAGWKLGVLVPEVCKSTALEGLGLVVSLIGVRMFFQSKNPIIVVASIALGGVVGVSLGISHWLGELAELARANLGGGGTFNEGLITASVLFCVGPMTVLGCLQDGIEGKSELLATKSVLDGISSFFFAATLGVGVLLTAIVVLIVQGGLTLLARPLRKVASHTQAAEEASAVGGAMILGIGLNLLNLKSMHVENYLPALFLAPVFYFVAQRLSKKEVPA